MPSTRRPATLVWASSPGAPPKDNSFSHPQLGWYQGRRVFFAGTGDGSVVCANARTGEPLWRVSLFRAGINATVLVHHADKIIAIYGTPYELGQMVALKMPDVLPANAAAGPVVLERKQLELWADDISSSTALADPRRRHDLRGRRERGPVSRWTRTAARSSGS